MNYSAAMIEGLANHNPHLRGMLNALFAKSYDDFVSQLYTHLDKVIHEVEMNRELRNNDKEDRVSIEIVLALRCFGYLAYHDTKSGGHVDIYVQSPSNMDWTWFGEAKWFNSKEYLYEGFQQLTTRYSIGTPNQSAGGLLIYIRQSNAANKLAEWKNHLESKFGGGVINFTDCPSRGPKLAFYTTHELEVSGCAFRIRHMGVVLHFDPQDKSGRQRK